jgi:transposase
MEYFAGLDVAMEETAICVIDREGKVVLEIKVATDPDAIFKALKPYAPRSCAGPAMKRDRCRRGCRSS